MNWDLYYINTSLEHVTSNGIFHATVYLLLFYFFFLWAGEEGVGVAFTFLKCNVKANHSNKINCYHFDYPITYQAYCTHYFCHNTTTYTSNNNILTITQLMNALTVQNPHHKCM